jgi:hypothetical protein
MVRLPRHRRGLAAVLATLFLLTAGSAPAAAELRASVDRDVVHEGETLRLTLSGSADAEVARTDLAPLAGDFEVLGTQQSQSVTIVDGRVDAQRSLDLVLRPRRSGEVTIPALRAGNEASEPIVLTVLDGDSSPPASAGAPPASARGASASSRAPALAPGEAPDLFVEAEVERTDPFVQGEVRYTVRVYDGVGIREGALTEPAADGVRVEPRGEPRSYEKVVGGRRYVVHEREYALFPQRSGDVTVPPVVLQARVADPSRGAARTPFGDPFDDAFADDVLADMLERMRAGGSPLGSSMFEPMLRALSPGREVRVRSNPVRLSVQARPAGAPSGWFLPARSVELSQSWQPANSAFRVGETVRRTIRLRADGASAAQLPALEVPSPDGIRQYAADAGASAVATADGAEAVLELDLVPTRAGTFTLPAVEVPWWDVEAKAARVATLPAQTIDVLPAPGGRDESAAPAQAAAPKPVPQQIAPAAQPQAAASPAAPVHDEALLVALLERPALAGAGGGLLVLLLASTWWLARRNRAPRIDARVAGARVRPGDDASRAAPHATPRALVDALHQACTVNDARAARDALAAWGRARWPEATASTSEVARRLGHAGLARAVKQLDDALYAPHAAAFDGAALWREFRAARKDDVEARPSTPAEALPALYPSSGIG